MSSTITLSPLPELKIGFLASHNGTNVKAIIAAAQAGALPHTTCEVIISNNPDATILAYAADHKLPHYLINRKQAGTFEEVDQAISEALQKHDVNFVILSGYMKPIGPKTLAAFPNKILNVHPALLPKYGGKGMYGDLVHQTVLDNGDSETGATIHIVNEEYDRGPIVKQAKVQVATDDTVETLRKKVQAEETKLFLEILAGLVA